VDGLAMVNCGKGSKYGAFDSPDRQTKAPRVVRGTIYGSHNRSGGTGCRMTVLGSFAIRRHTRLSSTGYLATVATVVTASPAPPGGNLFQNTCSS